MWFQRILQVMLVATIGLAEAGCHSSKQQAKEAATNNGPVVPAGLRVMSFNVRNSNAMDLLDHWNFRKGLFFKVIRDFDPDLIGMQEVLADQYDQIRANMNDYTPVGVARDDGKRKGEWALILFRASRFDLIDQGNFWLSQTPEVPGSKSWDAALTRICSWARLRDRNSKREFLFANTHYDHVGKVARVNASKLIMTRLPEIARGLPVVLTGDFNTTEDDPPYKTITHPTENGQLQLADSYREVHPVRLSEEASFNGFKGTMKGSRIDFILHTPELKATGAEIVRTHSDEGRFPSDHYPVTANMEWKESK